MATGEPLRDYYAILGVDPAASTEEIKNAYRERAKRFHPDHAGPGTDPARFRLLREAYGVLTDPLERAAYDARLRARVRTGGRRNGSGGRRPRRDHAGGWARWRVWRGLALLGAVAVAALSLWLWWTQARIAVLEKTLRQAATVGATAISPPGTGGDPTAASTSTGIGGEIRFRPGTTELDRVGAQQLAVLLTRIDRAVRDLPADADWHLVISARARQAVSGSGLPLEVWERTLARFARVADRVVAAGLPAERIAFRFVAGPYKAAVPVDENRLYLRFRCCGGARPQP